MAAERPEVDIVIDGVELKDPVNNQTFIQNLYKNRGIWESREGFGTIAEINGMLNGLDLRQPSPANPTGSASADYIYGLEKCLGSYAYKTSFGNDQIISVFLARNNTGNIYVSESDKVYYYAVVIYDATTNNYWYETLYKHTGDQTEAYRINSQGKQDVLQVSPYYKSYYETRDYGTDFQGTILANNLSFFFNDYLGKVYFGNSQGVWVYNPAAFIDNRYKQVNYVNSRDELNDQQSNHYGETGLITPISFVDGQFAEDNTFTYIQGDEIQGFVDIDSFEGRLIYAAGRTIYFTDVGVPNAIISSNSFTFWEMTGNITAIQQLNGNIIVWSGSQTFLYQPSSGTLLSGGRSIRVHDEIGCISAQTTLFRENVVYWVDSNGVYVTTNGLQIEEISLPIKRFFQYETTNPLIHYFANNGFATPNTESPDFIYTAFKNFEKVHLDYDQVDGQLFVVFPELSIAWVYKNGWYLWNFSSIVESEVDPETEEVTYLVGKTLQCDEPRFVSTQTKTYVVGGKKQQEMYYTTGNNIEGYDETLVGTYTSFRIFEWKRGGAQDGSTYDYIEGRRFAGFYRKVQSKDEQTIQDAMTTYIDPVERFGGYLNVDKSILWEQNDDLYLLPIRITPDMAITDSIGILNYNLSFYIDKTRWLPIYWDNGTNDAIYFILPTERCSDYAGYSPSTAVATSGVTFDTTSGLVTIKWDGSLIPANNLSYGARMNIRGENKHDLIYIPIQKVNRNTSIVVKNPTTNIVTSIVSYNWEVLDRETMAGVDVLDGNVFDWNPGWFQLVTEEERTQGVDWVYKSSQLGIEDTAQIKARGSYSLISTTGVGQQIKPWLYGIWNSVAGSDYKDYVSQNIDFVGTDALRQDLVNIAQIGPVRSRFRETILGVVPRYFDIGATYGSTADPTAGNYYVDNQEVDTIATSDSVRGESVSYTFFGFMQDKANKVLIRNIKIALQAVAGRRRRGR